MEILKPGEIERKSFDIIASEARISEASRENLPVLLRVIHATADFDYVDNLKFSDEAVATAQEALKRGAAIITDTNMALAGVNKEALEKAGCRAYCFMADEDVKAEALRLGTTRAAVAVEKAARLEPAGIYAVGNAPTALIKIRELTLKGILKPALIVAVPVGFVNVVESKEAITTLGIPYIAAMGRKGGSSVAAAILNALLYETFPIKSRRSE